MDKTATTPRALPYWGIFQLTGLFSDLTLIDFYTILNWNIQPKTSPETIKNVYEQRDLLDAHGRHLHPVPILQDDGRIQE